MTDETVNAVVVVAAVGALIGVAVAALIVAIAMWRVSGDVRRVTRSLDQLVGSVREDLPPALSELRQSAASLKQVSDGLEPRLKRVDSLLDEADATAASVRATAEAAEDIVRGPAAAMDRAKRSVSAVGEGLARGADRLRRSVEERTGRAKD